MRHTSAILLLVISDAVVAQQPQQRFVPAANQHADANSHLWIAGASMQVRQQTLVGSSHLQAPGNLTITGLAWRRTAANETYVGGMTNLTVSLSTSPFTPLTCSNSFAANVGVDARQVFQGLVSLPASPPAAGPNVAWSTTNVVQVTFAQPFVYQGGTLCIDVIGNVVAGQTADWWMADAVFENVSGNTLETGLGCGSRGARWSFVEPRTLLSGAYATFRAHGSPNGLGIAVFGAPGAFAIPLSSMGLAAPNCFCHLDPGVILGTLTAPFVPESAPQLAPMGGVAMCRLHIPNQTWTLGMQLATQWLDLTQPATSNAIRWTISQNIPTLDMALIEGHASQATGELSVHFAHVLRFDCQ